ncbi:MAG: hypothetical protein ACRD3J_16005 [Thermoanaerobaculia bacterium]
MAQGPNISLQRTSARRVAPGFAAELNSLGAGMKVVAYFVAMGWLIALSGCTDCKDRIVQHAGGIILTADVHERVCGSAAGLTVRVFPPGTREKEGDARDDEPFQSRCPPDDIAKVGVVASWRDLRHLEVRYSPALKVLRAEKQWKGVNINYLADEHAKAGT